MTKFFFVGILILNIINGQEVYSNWLLNTYNGNPNWVETFVNDMWVSNDGYVFTTCTWDENGRPASIWKNGQYMGQLDLNQNQLGGLAITGYNYDNNNVVIFTANGVNSPATMLWKFNKDGSALNWDGMNTNIIVPPNNTTVYSLASNKNYLVISDPNNDRILLYNSSNGKYINEFKFERPADIAIDLNENLWIIQASYSYKGYPIPIINKYYGVSNIFKYDISGNYLNINISNPNINVPVSVFIQQLSNNQQRLLIGDFGVTQSIYGYTNIETNPILDESFYNHGVFGYSAYNDKGNLNNGMNNYRLSSVGGDMNNNIYTNNGGPVPKGDSETGTDLRSFDNNGNLLWWIYGQSFVMMGDTDPSNENIFYTQWDKFVYNVTTNKWIFNAITYNKFLFPEDTRVLINGTTRSWLIHQNIFARRLNNGILYLFMNQMAGDQGAYDIYRFDESNYGDIAIPSARWFVNSNNETYPFNQPVGEYIWHDNNGNGKYDDNEYTVNNNTAPIYRDGSWVDYNGNIWTPYRNEGIRMLKLISFDQFNNPVYTFNPRQLIDIPYPMTDIHFIRYFVETDTLYLAGWTINNSVNKDTPSYVGTICRYNNFLNKTGTMSFVWETPSKYYNITSNQQSWDIADDYIFTIGIKDDHVINVWSINDGTLVTSWSPPKSFGNDNEIGWVDIWDSGIRAHKLNNGSYTIFVEEDGRNKIIQYIWNP